MATESGRAGWGSGQLALVSLATILAATQPVSAQSLDTVVRRAERPIHEGIAQLTLELRAGRSASGETNFGMIREMAVGPDGAIYVDDRGLVLALDSAGRFVRTLGHRGENPGGYNSVNGLAVTSDNRILVWDPVNKRINAYSPDGSVLPTLWTGATRTRASHLLHIDVSDRVYIRESGIMTPQGPVYLSGMGQLPPGTPGMLTSFWQMYEKDGTWMRTIRPPAFPVTATILSGRAPLAVTFVLAPFHPMPSVALTPEGKMVMGIGSRYAFEIHDSAGRVVSVRRDVQPSAISDRERDSARTAMTERMRRDDPPWTWNGPDVPRMRPVYDRIDVGVDGSIWIQLVDRPDLPDTAATPTTRHDLFEPDGTYVGQVAVPRNVTLHVRRAGRVWGVEVGNDGIERVVRYLIRWP